MAIRMEGICKTYRSGRGRVEALSDVTETIEQGSATAVVGKSGSGKSTLLNCIGGLERPDRGRVRCFGTDVHALSGRSLSLFQRRQVGFVFQSGNLLSYLTVRNNIALPLALNGVAGREQHRRVLTLLEGIGLPGVGSALPRELSGGEAQRVAFARAVAHGPRILLADEPTANLDSPTGSTLVQLMLELVRDRGCTLVVSTHDPVVIEQVDRTLHLRDGRLIPGEVSSTL
jgi:putative ABC transport system ATP-binding protein